MSSGIIREFLVSLGFRIDEQQMRRFQDGITGSTAAVSGLGRSALDTALQVVDAVEKMAKQYEGLHYASQRTHSTVGNLKAIAYASSQVGMSAEEGAAAVEGFAQALLTPGKAEWLKSLGVTSKDAAEGVGQLMKSLKKTYGDGTVASQNIAQNIAGGAGINPGAFLQIWNNSEKFFKYFDAYNASLGNAGLNTKKVADESTDLMNSIRELESHLDIAKTKMLEGLVKPTEDAVKWFDRLVVRLEKTGGFIDKITGKTPNGSEESWIDSLFSPFIRDEDRAEWNKGIKERNEKWRDPSRDPLKPNIAALPKSMLHRRASGATSASEPESSSGTPPTDPKARRQYVADFFMRRGWPKEKAWAITGTLGGETSNFNPAQGGGWIRGKDGRLHKEDSYGAGQWHKERRDTFARVFGHPMQGSSLDEELGFVDWELKNTHKKAGEHLMRTNTPYAGVGVLVPEYEIPADIPGNIRSRGADAEKWFRADLGASRGGDMQTAPSAPDTANAPPSNAINQTNHFTVNAGGLDEAHAKSAVMAALRTATGYMYVELDRLR